MAFRRLESPRSSSVLPPLTITSNEKDLDFKILGVPHKAYRGLDVGGKDVVDVWGALGSGIQL